MSEGEIRGIARAMKEMDVRCVGPCHCSGQEARRAFHEEFGPGFIEVGVGRRITLREIERIMGQMRP